MTASDALQASALDEAATRLAGFWIRFSADFIDAIPLGVVWFVASREISGLAGDLIAAVVVLVYYTYFEGSSGQTPGKRLCDIRVVDSRSGSHIGFARAALRFCLSYLSRLAFFLGYLWMLWDEDRQTWHDKASRSIVILTATPQPARTYRSYD